MRKELASLQRISLNFGAGVMLIQTDEDVTLEIPKSYAAYIADGEPSISIAVHKGCPKDFGAEVIRTHSKLGLSVAKTPDDSTILVVDGLGREGAVQTAIVTADLLQGEIYLGFPESTTNVVLSTLVPLDRLITALILAAGRGFLVHAAGVTIGNQGVLFVGDSGAGKSTLASLCRDTAGIDILSDEQVVLQQIDGQLYVSGTPWHSRVFESSPLLVPLKHVFFIEHSQGNNLMPITPSQVVTELSQQVSMPLWDKEGISFILELVAVTAETVPAHRLGFVPDCSALDLVRCAISD